ncbi:MAG: helix-turn-helix domain-containing protein [Candidatus Eisenbacteria bacterium]
MHVGRKIRDLRLRRGLTVHQLATASGLSKGFISQLENGITSPSLASLTGLATVLGTSIAYLVASDSEAMCVVRRTERRRIEVGGNASRVESLTPGTVRNLDVVMAELPPGLTAGDKQHYHQGEEFLLCVEGRIRVTCAGQVAELDEGDAAHFDGRAPHAVENVGERTARIIIVVTPAAFEPMVRVKSGQPPVKRRRARAAVAPAAGAGRAPRNGRGPVRGTT